MIHLCGVANVIENVELSLRAEEAGVSNAGGGQVLLSLAGNVTRVAGEWLASERIVDEELDVQGLRLAERIDASGREVRQQVHVGLFDGSEAADGGAVECEAFLYNIFVERVSRDGEVLLLTRDIGESDVDELNVVILDVLDDFFGSLE